MESTASSISIFAIDPGLMVWSIFSFGVIWIVPIVLSVRFAGRRGRHWALGFGLAFFLGWVGFLLLVLFSPKQSDAEQVRSAQ